jgi:hypothetical protein
LRRHGLSPDLFIPMHGDRPGYDAKATGTAVLSPVGTAFPQSCHGLHATANELRVCAAGSRRRSPFGRTRGFGDSTIHHGDSTADALVPGRLDAPQPSRSKGCDGIIAGTDGISWVASILVEVKMRGSDWIGGGGSPWHGGHAAARPNRMVASAADHGAMACCGVSMRMKISRP